MVKTHTHTHTHSNTHVHNNGGAAIEVDEVKLKYLCDKMLKRVSECDQQFEVIVIIPIENYPITSIRLDVNSQEELEQFVCHDISPSVNTKDRR